MKRRNVFAALALALPMLAGCNDGVLPSGPPAPARAPRPPADELDAALAGDDALGAMLRAWCSDIGSEPLRMGELA